MKPRVTSADLPFFIENQGNNIFLGLGDNNPASLSDRWRSQINELPYVMLKNTETIDEPIKRIDYTNNGSIEIDYCFLGGFNNNALKVTWEIIDQVDQLIWIAVKTFTGIQLKYITPENNGFIIFAFADEDAYCYCDYSPCKECVFRCKHGFILYAYCQTGKLIKKACDRLNKEYRSTY